MKKPPNSSTQARQLLVEGTRVLERYRVVEQVAAGGLSVVYRGVDERLGREVCIKVLHALAMEEAAEAYRRSHDLFVKEAQSLSRLGHPTTLRIYDFGYMGSTPVQVSEFARGGTLEDLLCHHGPLPAEQLLKIASGLCGALGEAHGQGIVHRDLKPKNVLFSTVAGGRLVKLADFGIAQHSYAEDPGMPEGHLLLMYSLNWAAPEQLVGAAVDPRTDVYALGLVVLYMATGRMLFRARRREEALTQRAATNERLAVIAEQHRLLPLLHDLIRQTCSIDLAARPAGVEPFLKALFSACGAEGACGSNEAMLVVIDGERGPDCHQVRPSRLHVGGTTAVGDRQTRFIPMEPGAEWSAGTDARIRASLLPDVGGRFCLHLQGINCFVRLDERPPSSAVQIKRPGRLTLLAPDSQVLARGAVHFGRPEAGHSIFSVDHQAVAIDARECQWIVGVDFGPAEAYRFLYAPAATSEPSTAETRG